MFFPNCPFPASCFITPYWGNLENFSKTGTNTCKISPKALFILSGEKQLFLLAIQKKAFGHAQDLQPSRMCTVLLERLLFRVGHTLVNMESEIPAFLSNLITLLTAANYVAYQ